MDTHTLKHILKQEMQGYAKQGLNAYSYLTVDDDETVYAVIDIALVPGKQLVGAVLVARLADERIIIELDLNDKPLADALRARGVPESQLICAYLQDKVTA